MGEDAAAQPAHRAKWVGLGDRGERSRLTPMLNISLIGYQRLNSTRSGHPSVFQSRSDVGEYAESKLGTASRVSQMRL